MEFTEFSLHPDLQRGIAETGYVTCMPVQEEVLKNAFGGHDLYVQSQTGTGKTAAYLIVIFQRFMTEPLVAGQKALIMVPTRELAVQVEEEAKSIGRYLPIKIGSFFGGVGYGKQYQMLRESVQIIIGTPGRILDLVESRHMNLSDVAFLVLDEADRMFDMGFYPDLRRLQKVLPPPERRQTMLFSATLNLWVKNLAWEYTQDPVEIQIEPEQVTLDTIEQKLYHVSSDDKMKILLWILKEQNPESVIIFCNTKRLAEVVAKRLRINGYDCEFIIGDLPQTKRLQIINDIKSGKLRYLVATDVAARGLDIDNLAMVINYELPQDAENYVHRIGRTARAGRQGVAISLVGESDAYELPAIEKYVHKRIPAEMASEDMFIPDASEGQYIPVDSYDESSDKEQYRHRSLRHRGKGESRRGPRKETAEAKTKRNKRNEEGSSLAKRAVDAAVGRAQDQQEVLSGGTRRKEKGKSRVPHGKRERPSQRVPKTASLSAKPSTTTGKKQQQNRRPDLSTMTFEERMAFYRQKYGPKGRGALTAPENRGKSRNEQVRLSPQQETTAEKAKQKGSFISRLIAFFKGER
ncbi:MAG: DEAD/DEAH box helicase [Treponemataceae bacterium]|nr:DEAD/DEAH box helicase [Treponemataceae bacterium]